MLQFTESNPTSLAENLLTARAFTCWKLKDHQKAVDDADFVLTIINPNN
jgi:hypothetical protein